MFRERNAVKLTSHFDKLNVTIGFLKLCKTCWIGYRSKSLVRDMYEYFESFIH